MLNDLYIPPKRGLDPDDKAAFVVGAVGPDQLETCKTAQELFQEQFATCMILDI
jgi:hypothetical protein